MPELRILVVEDNEIGMMLVHDLLKLSGYAVLKAFDSETALQLAKNERPDLIVMDIGLAPMDGLATTRILKADPETAPIPVLALTAHAMPGDAARTLAAGCAAYLAKPLDIHVFLVTVARLLGTGKEAGG